jgi:oxaloacetate decarboxylase beta subunit
MNLINNLVKFLTIGCAVAVISIMASTAQASTTAEPTSDIKEVVQDGEHLEMDIGDSFKQLWSETGIRGFMGVTTNFTEHVDATSGKTIVETHINAGWKNFVMIVVGLLLLFLAIKKGFEPLLLVPIGFGCILANIPGAQSAMTALPDPATGEMGSFLGIIYYYGVQSGLFPLLIFMGVGAMTDFGPLIAHPKTALLGAAAQFGIFVTLLGAIALGIAFPQMGFGEGLELIKTACSIGIIGGADGPTAIYTARLLSPKWLGSIAVAAYSYMALVPIIQPPIMRLLTTKEERQREMSQLRHVTKLEKIMFPIIVLTLCALLLPSATPLIGALMFGNLAKECAVVDRLSDTMQNALINIVTIMLGLAVGMKLSADHFLNIGTIGILILGLIAFSIGTAAGIIMAKIMHKFSKEPINPLIGAAGVSAVPMAARVANKVGLEENPHNFLLMHAMGPNVSGVIGSAVAAGVLIAICNMLAG